MGVLLHDERAVQVQQRCRWSCGHPQSSFNRPEGGQRRRIGECRKREDGYQHGRWQVQARLGDGQQRVLFAAVAVVIVIIMAGPARRRAWLDAFVGSCGCVMVGFVIVAAPGRMFMGYVLDRGVRFRGIARFARGQPHAKVAAAHWNRYRKKQCDEQAECAVALEHARGEYIDLELHTPGRLSGFAL